MSSPATLAMQDKDAQRRSIRRWTIGLLLVVLAFYFGFILMGVLRS